MLLSYLPPLPVSWLLQSLLQYIYSLQLQASSDLHTHAPESLYTEHSVLDATNTRALLSLSRC